jgi:hypothetical protein
MSWALQLAQDVAEDVLIQRGVPVPDIRWVVAIAMMALGKDDQAVHGGVL